MMLSLLLALQCTACTSDSTQVVNIIDPLIVSGPRYVELQRLAALPPRIERQVDSVEVLVLDTALLRQRIEAALAAVSVEEGGGLGRAIERWGPWVISGVALLGMIYYAQKDVRRDSTAVSLHGGGPSGHPVSRKDSVRPRAGAVE